MTLSFDQSQYWGPLYSYFATRFQKVLHLLVEMFLAKFILTGAVVICVKLKKRFHSLLLQTAHAFHLIYAMGKWLLFQVRSFSHNSRTIQVERGAIICLNIRFLNLI